MHAPLARSLLIQSLVSRLFSRHGALALCIAALIASVALLSMGAYISCGIAAYISLTTLFLILNHGISQMNRAYELERAGDGPTD